MKIKSKLLPQIIIINNNDNNNRQIPNSSYNINNNDNDNRQIPTSVVTATITTAKMIVKI